MAKKNVIARSEATKQSRRRRGSPKVAARGNAPGSFAEFTLSLIEGLRMTKKFRQIGICHLIFGTLLFTLIFGSVFLFRNELESLVSKLSLSEAKAGTVGVTATVELTVQPACHDGIDNDSDGLMDYPADPGCSDIYDTDEYNPPACNDGIDNDGDGLIDFPDDRGCSNASDTDESDELACNDGIDNDGDGLIDYPNDPGCENLSDADEYNAPSGGGGGGGLPPTIVTSVVILGRAYPESQITILKDGQIFTTAFADKDANFKVQITNITAGVHTFGAWSEDNQKRKSLTYSFTANVIEKMTTTISGVFLPPTIAIDRTQLNKGETLNVLGQTAPQSEISIHFSSDNEIIAKVKSENDGTWLLAYNTSPLEDGQHSTKAKSATFDNLQSIFSQSLAFIVGKGVLPGATCPKADLNKDGRVNLIDFSILMFWWNKANACADQNKDGVVNLPDFSIMMYWWTG